MKNKKADLSMNFIIIAALALLVLVTISLIFMGRFNIFNRQAQDCYSAGGECVDQTRWPTCKSAAQDGGYSAGTRRNDLSCYNANGNVRENEMCCVFIE